MPVVVATLVSAAAVVLFPEAAAISCSVVWGVALAWALPRNVSLGVPLSLLLLVPADHIKGLNGPVLGLSVFTAATILFLSAVLRGRYVNPLRRDWDCLLLIALLIGATLLQAGLGEVRGILFWAAAALMLYWFRAEEPTAALPTRQIGLALVVAASISSTVAVVDYLGLLGTQELLPGYEPAQLDFVQFMGLRAVGMSGHPLRLGTLTMLSSLITLAWLIDGRPSVRARNLLVFVFGLSLSGLVLSGARGSWLGFVVGYFALVGLRWSRATLRRLWRGAVMSAALGVLLVATGLWPLIHERLFGSAFHPGSIGQRIAALQSVAVIWRDVPLLGAGFGGAVDLTQKAGLRLPNLENEYLRFFLAAGLMGPLALLTVSVRRIRGILRSAPSAPRTAALAAVVSLSINMATYNVFGWSVAPALFVMVALISQPGALADRHDC